MATKYEKQATQQLAPVYNQQVNAIQSQIPAIESLYQTLTQGLNQQYNTNLASGVQGINEDASARGVLRSTLPNDARAGLTAQLGAALQQSLGQIGAQRAGDIAGVNSQVGDLRIKKVGAINDLALNLRQQAQQEKQFNQEMAFAQAKAASSGGSGGSVPQWQVNQALNSSLNQDILGFFGSSKAATPRYTEEVILPKLIAAYPELKPQDIVNAVYSNRKALGLG